MTSRGYSSSPSISKRTNSLGRAAADCFSCQRARRTTQLIQACDRQRPRCNNCTRAKQVCGGYQLKLQWVKHIAAPIAEPRSIKRPATSRSPMPTISQHYTFVAEDVATGYIDTSFADSSTGPTIQDDEEFHVDYNSNIDEAEVFERGTAHHFFAGDLVGDFSLAWSHGIAIPFTRPRARSHARHVSQEDDLWMAADLGSAIQTQEQTYDEEASSFYPQSFAIEERLDLEIPENS